MKLPENYFYTRDHEWVSSKTGQVTIGVTAYAVEQLGDIVHVELPEPGDEFEAGDSFGTIESTKTVSDLYLPAAGKVLEINDAIQEHPEKLQESPFEGGWLIKVEFTASAEELMTPSEYDSFIQE